MEVFLAIVTYLHAYCLQHCIYAQLFLDLRVASGETGWCGSHLRLVPPIREWWSSIFWRFAAWADPPCFLVTPRKPNPVDTSVKTFLFLSQRAGKSRAQPKRRQRPIVQTTLCALIGSRITLTFFHICSCHAKLALLHVLTTFAEYSVLNHYHFSKNLLQKW